MISLQLMGGSPEVTVWFFWLVVNSATSPFPEFKSFSNQWDAFRLKIDYIKGIPEQTRLKIIGAGFIPGSQSWRAINA